jgi:hypothetical protein
MNPDEQYHCSMCGKVSANREWYIKHLVADHPSSWLARRAITEQALREKQKNASPK